VGLGVGGDECGRFRCRLAWIFGKALAVDVVGRSVVWLSRLYLLGGSDGTVESKNENSPKEVRLSGRLSNSCNLRAKPQRNLVFRT
jgi:hypothetical protein